MTEEEAVAIVEQEREALRIPPRMGVSSAEKAIVEFMKDRSRAGRVENRVAWIVDLADAVGFVRVHVDDRSGEILEVLRTV